MRLSDSQHMYAADHAAINERGIPGAALMKNAARAVAEAALRHTAPGGRACALCGSGNNGGDGIGAAAEMLRAGVRVRVFLVGRRESMSADSREMERELISLGGRLEAFDPGEPDLAEYLQTADVIIDALFGIGLSREVGGIYESAVKLINASDRPVVAADIPSGVCADTGEILRCAVAAAETVTFSMAKPGHFAEPGCTCCGRVTVADIGIPRDLLDGAGTDIYAVTDGDVFLPRRPALSHKGDYGRLLILGGSVGYTGAPTLCARAAVRAGAGLVHLGVPESIYGITAVKNDEAMPFPLPEEDGKLAADAVSALERVSGAQVLAVGPGMGRSEGTATLTRRIVEGCALPMVLDADALYALAQDMSVLRRSKGTVVLTPHEMEYRRMGGDVRGGRVQSARAFARKHGCILVLKGHRTLAAFPDGEVYIATRGNPGMAKGGTGDVLTGIIAAMLCQLEPKRAVITAMHLHALCGDLCRSRLGEYAMTASDIIETLPEATKTIIKEQK